MVNQLVELLHNCLKYLYRHLYKRNVTHIYSHYHSILVKVYHYQSEHTLGNYE